MNDKNLKSESVSGFDKTRKRLADELIASTRRPRERVERFLAAELARTDSMSSLPPGRNIASLLEVSLSTVQTVIKDLAEQGILETRIGDGTYINKQTAPTNRKRDLCLSFGWGEEVSGRSWRYAMGGSILHAAAEARSTYQVTPLLLTKVSSTDEYRAAIVEKMNDFDAFIFFGDRLSFEMQRICEHNAKRCIHINAPHDTATSNFISADYFNSCFRVGRAWRECGRLKPVFIAPDLNHSVSARQMFAGLRAGYGFDRDIIYHRSRDVSREAGRDCMRELFGSHAHVDAAICQGDLLALGVLDELDSHKIKAGADFSVVGSSGLAQTDKSYPEITSFGASYASVGSATIRMLDQLFAQDMLQITGNYLPVDFIGYQSTSAKENDILRADS